MAQATFVQVPIDLIQYVRGLKLSGTQYDLWLYLWSKDPFGDRFIGIPSPEIIAAELGVNPRTIQRAAQRLQDADLFDFQVEAWKCRNTTLSTPIGAPDKKIRIRTKRSNLGQKDPVSDKKIQSWTKRSNLGQKDPNAELEPAEHKASRSLQTLQTYSDFKDSLSDSEREKFLDFVRKEIKNFARPICDLEAWLASQTKAGENRWFVYYEKFQLSLQQPLLKAPKKRRLHEEIEQRKRELEQLASQQQAG